ncbi:hypothetical protein B0H13DRAFT_1918591 [Mycena leptocephala]|nr:hypothetical protein B0H13DRAFT_1918591 [Mycena leptocephala]
MWGSSSPLASVSRRLRVNRHSTFIARGPPTPTKTPTVIMGQSLAKGLLFILKFVCHSTIHGQSIVYYLELRIPRGKGIPPKVRGLEVPKVVKPCDLLLSTLESQKRFVETANSKVNVSDEYQSTFMQEWLRTFQGRPLKVGRQVLEVYLQGLGGKVEVYLLEVRGFGGRGRESPHFVAPPAIIWPMVGRKSLPVFIRHISGARSQISFWPGSSHWVKLSICTPRTRGLRIVCTAFSVGSSHPQEKSMLREMSLSKVDRQILRAGGNPTFASAAAAFAYAIFV